MASSELPLVTVITPSFNQGKFIRETIESVLTQEYPHIEHIVIDGGSSDETLGILKEYESRDSRFRFVSEPDNGQSHALNKGLKFAEGSIIGWLNSDDTYLTNSVKKAVDTLENHPEWAMVYGSAYITNEENKILKTVPVQPFNIENLFDSCIICQPAAFIKKKVLDKLGGIDESFDFCMDYDLWLRISKNNHIIGYVEDFLANSRFHPSSKSATSFVDIGFPEILRTSVKNLGTASNNWINYFLLKHYNKGLYWYLKLFKSNSIFGITPKISHSNLYEDSWAPPFLRLFIENNEEKPLHALIIKGTQKNYQWSAFRFYLNGKCFKTMKVDKGPFTIEIEIPSQQTNPIIDIICKQTHISNDNRKISYKITEMIPLSEEEYQFIKEFRKGSNNVVNWINHNRKPIPNFS